MNWQRVLREESMAGINEWPRRDAAERLRQWPRIMGLAGAVSSPPFLGVVLLGSFARGEAEARRMMLAGLPVLADAVDEVRSPSSSGPPAPTTWPTGSSVPSPTR